MSEDCVVIEPYVVIVVRLVNVGEEDGADGGEDI